MKQRQAQSAAAPTLLRRSARPACSVPVPAWQRSDTMHQLDFTEDMQQKAQS